VLVGWLLGEHRVTVLDTFMYEQPSLAEYIDWCGLTIIKGDARDTIRIRELLAKHDVVIPLAAIVGAPACDLDPTAAETTNYGAIAATCAYMSSEQWLLYPNTNSGYGTTGAEACTEETPLKPISLYGKTKCDAEKRVMERQNSIAFRLATVFGVSPRMRTDLMVNDWVRQDYLNKKLSIYQPEARRNFVHVRDVAGAFRHAIENFGKMRGEVYNCGDTRANMTKAELADKIGVEWFPAEGKDKDRRDYLISNAKLEATGWKPNHTIDGGIRELRQYYLMTNGRAEGNV
jgi:nucleoside-diphosphate-sugar epimerase